MRVLTEFCFCQILKIEDIPASESVPVLLLHLDAEAGIAPGLFVGYGEEIAFFRRQGQGRVHS